MQCCLKIRGHLSVVLGTYTMHCNTASAKSQSRVLLSTYFHPLLWGGNHAFCLFVMHLSISLYLSVSLLCGVCAGVQKLPQLRSQCSWRMEMPRTPLLLHSSPTGGSVWVTLPTPLPPHLSTRHLLC